MNGNERRTAATILTVGCLAAAIGLIEGILLAWVYDPFGAGWGSRGLSLLAFVSAYFAAGCLLGTALGLPLHLMRAGRFAPASACGLMGALYAGGWLQAMGGDSRMRGFVGLTAMVVAGLLCAALGTVLSGALRRSGVWTTAGCFAASLVCALLLRSPSMPEPTKSLSQPPPARPAASRPAQPAPPRNLLVVVADTLRADHLSLYGYERPTSPELTRYAKSGTTFTNAITSKTKTSPSVASLFTGTYPHTHGIVTCRTPLPDHAVTLAEVLHARDFTTHAIVANSNVGGFFNFNQGFDSVDEIWADPASADARGVTDHALTWLEGRRDAGGDRPFFLYVHYIDPHLPYGSPAPWTDRFVNDPLYGRLKHLQVRPGYDSVGSIRPTALLETNSTDVDEYVARYDGEIAYLDLHMGRLFEGLTKLGLDRDTLVVFTADHGESLWEHEIYFAHGGFAYEDAARVPLVIVAPGQAPRGGRITRTVETVALAPTALEALGLPAPPSMEAISFWDLVTSPAAQGEGTAFIEADTSISLRYAIRGDRWKLIENSAGFDRGAGRFDIATIMNMHDKARVLEMVTRHHEFLGRYELYDLQEDPGETRNLAGARPDIVETMLPRLNAWLALGAPGPRLRPTRNEEMPEDVLRNLKSLGYVK